MVNEKLKKLREESGLTQKEVSEKMNYSTAQFISNWERGISHPPIKDIKKLSKIYKIEAIYLYYNISDSLIEKYSEKLERQFEKSKA